MGGYDGGAPATIFTVCHTLLATELQGLMSPCTPPTYIGLIYAPVRKSRARRTSDCILYQVDQPDRWDDERALYVRLYSRLIAPKRARGRSHLSHISRSPASLLSIFGKNMVKILSRWLSHHFGCPPHNTRFFFSLLHSGAGANGPRKKLASYLSNSF